MYQPKISLHLPRAGEGVKVVEWALLAWQSLRKPRIPWDGDAESQPLLYLRV